MRDLFPVLREKGSKAYMAIERRKRLPDVANHVVYGGNRGWRKGWQRRDLGSWCRRLLCFQLEEGVRQFTRSTDLFLVDRKIFYQMKIFSSYRTPLSFENVFQKNIFSQNKQTLHNEKNTKSYQPW
ncbi:Uncharacterized protein TCM_001833 [Theobroma cacao]|uniref:Uncharacterized protein n=1 Tax=Theobroma cacao TaxID=3641 RepID=A0A061DLL3_THECC|nr:Uncharacterized protein TCM_001833 [Theobroma cacao]